MWGVFLFPVVQPRSDPLGGGFAPNAGTPAGYARARRYPVAAGFLLTLSLPGRSGWPHHWVGNRSPAWFFQERLIVGVTYLARFWAQYKANRWLFEMPLPTMPMPPFIGMWIEGLHNQNSHKDDSDEWEVEYIVWNLKRNEVEVLFKDDVWLESMEDGKTPDQYFTACGWKLIFTR